MRQANRERVEAKLLEVAAIHLAEYGPAALSIRAIARDMEMAPSALFRYVSGRDELLTRLIVAAYDSLGENVERAEARVKRADYSGRWRAIGRATRRWALANRHEWTLIFGSPVPQYDAPGEQTNQAGTRVTDLLVSIRHDLATSGVDPGAADWLDETAAAKATAGALGEVDAVGAPTVLVRGILAWTMLIGSINRELFSQLGDDLGNADALFEVGVEAAGHLLLGAAYTPKH